MWMLTKYALGLLLFQTSFSLASPARGDLSETGKIASPVTYELGLQKRYPIAVNYDPSVPNNERQVIDQAFQDMQTFATAAANYNFANSAGNIDGIYVKYFPQGREAKIQALFRHLAGIPQQWGGQQLTSPDFSRIIIRREGGGGSDHVLADCRRVRDNYNITIYDLAMRRTSPSIAAANFRGTKTSTDMESLGAIILHELLHATGVIVTPIMSFDSPTDTRIRPLISPMLDDQTLPGWKTCYGSFLSNKLKNTDGELAFRNIDNYMYFALVSTHYLKEKELAAICSLNYWFANAQR
ncbi:MAG: hypothetical protein M1836_003737 [Candelina mexicana]|nr:MAG: hypothetical protein M1836_003737 [Candelina mexicana]